MDQSIAKYHDLVQLIVANTAKLWARDATTYMSISLEITKGLELGLLNNQQCSDLRYKLRDRWEGGQA